MAITQKLTNRIDHSRKGFTLIELVIVLAVASLLFAGLWRLLSGGNTAIRDQAAADLQTQLTNSVKSYLNTVDGRTYITRTNANTAFTLVLPAGVWVDNATCLAQLPVVSLVPTDPDYDPTGRQNGGLCQFLPNGFNATTTNSYNQTFQNINVLKDNQPAGQPPVTYSFMILTQNGDTIPDTSGGRISASIGNDGGFIYSDTDVCNAAAGVADRSAAACGAYGTWAQNVNTFAYAVAVTNRGRIASRTVVNTAATTDIWLARKPFVSGLTVPATGQDDFHSLQADTFMDGTASFNMEGSNLFLGRAGAGAFSTIWGPNSNVGAAGLVDPSRAASEITNVARIQVGNNNDRTNPTLIVNGPNGVADSLISDPTKLYRASCGTGVAGGPSALDNCAFIALFNGNVRASGMLYANFLYANSFVYDTSDIRLKKDIKPLNNVLDKLSQVKGMSFIKPNDTKTSFGVLAQDVEKVYPELVYTIGDGYKAVDYIGMIGPLVAAVNELRDQNIALKKTIEENQSRIKELEKHGEKL